MPSKWLRVIPDGREAAGKGTQTQSALIVDPLPLQQHPLLPAGDDTGK
jgi:hypothetical protein